MRQIARRVRELVDSGFFELPPGVSATAGDPLAVVDPAGELESWLVPFTASGKLVAWARMLPDLTPLEFSLLAGGRTDLAPDAADWLDPARIRARISAAAGDAASLPVLTYDRTPARLAWMAYSRGGSRRWWAAGTTVWEDHGDWEVTGGGESGSRK